jgi:DNA repair protein RecO (recombination protein O)
MSQSQAKDRRQRTFRSEAVVLRHHNWGEADRILWLFTLDQGKIRAIAKGVRKPRSRKSGHLEPFTRVNLLLARGRDIPIITQADTLDAFLSLREGLLLTTYASYVVELLDRFTFEEEENRALYRLLVNTLKHLSKNEHLEIVLRYYEIRLLDLVGFRPQLFECVVCGEEIKPADQYFSALLGGVICPKCVKGATGTLPISLTTLKYLRHFQRSSFVDAKRAKLTDALNREMENLIQYYITYLLERGLNTPAFIRRARKQPGDIT